MRAVEISQSGLDVEWKRLEVVAQNLANMNSTRTATGEAYHPMRLLSGPDLSFGQMLAGHSQNAAGVRVLGVEPQSGAMRLVHEPGHPHANADGFVAYPDIDHASEMTLMIKASRTYEANLVAISIAQDMYARALDIGRQA